MLLTDGDFDDNEAVVRWIDDHNPDHGIKINTISFHAQDQDGDKVLAVIAEHNGGMFKRVSE